MIAVGLVGGRDRFVPVVAADVMFADGGDGIPEVVVVVNCVLGLRLGRVLPACALAKAQQCGIEVPLLCLGV